MRGSNKGFSLLELMMAMSILFLASIFLLELFISTSRYSLRSKEYWTASLLAQSKLEVLSQQESPRVVNPSGNCGGEFKDYWYQIDTDNYERGAARMIRVTVVSPGGVHASFALLL